MGIHLPPAPPDYGDGDDCSRCLAPGHTPNYVFVRFWDIVACAARPDPPNGYTFVCAQDPLNACQFSGSLEFGGYTWEAFFQYSVFSGGIWKSFLELTIPGSGWNAFFADDGPECGTIFDSPYTVCPGWSGGGGRAIVDVVMTSIIIMLTGCYHFVTQRPTFYEHFPCGIDHHNIRLASKFDNTNVLVLFDEEDLDLAPHWTNPLD